MTIPNTLAASQGDTAGNPHSVVAPPNTPALTLANTPKHAKTRLSLTRYPLDNPTPK